MENPIKNVFDSFKNNNLGYSGRKLSALAGVLTGIVITMYKLPIDAQLHALYCWLLFALLLMGVVTFQNIIELKNGKSTSVKETKTTETTKEVKDKSEEI